MEGTIITKKQRDIMRHALGLDYAAEPFRNHYVTDESGPDYEECKKLEGMGIMQSHRRSWVPGVIFVVTDLGKTVLRKEAAPCPAP